MVAELSLALLRDDRGVPVHFIAQIVDLSERRALRGSARVRTRTRSTSSVAGLEAVFDTVAVGLLLLDADGNHRLRNARHRELLDLAFPAGHDGQAGQDGFVFDAEQTRRLSFDEMPEVRAAAGEEFQDMLRLDRRRSRSTTSRAVRLGPVRARRRRRLRRRRDGLSPT